MLVPAVSLYSEEQTLHCFGRSGSGPKLNALNRVRPSKKINFYFFNCVLFEKLEGNPNFILVGSDLVKKILILILIFNCVLLKN